MSPLPVRPPTDDGLIGRMVRNRVLPNIVMLFLIGGGFFMTLRIKQEVFPEFSLDIVSVRVPYPGASPEEVERGILLSIEEGVRGIEGIKQLRAEAGEGIGTVTIELDPRANHHRIYQDVQQQVNRIRTFPRDAERPVVSLDIRRREVIDLQVYGDVSEWVLREVAEQVRDRLLQEPGVTQIEYEGARSFEIHVEIAKEDLRAYGLTLDEVARRIREHAVEVPGGTVETRSGEVLLRVTERRDWAREFEKIPIVVSPGGALLTLADIARVQDGFEDVDISATFDGVRAIGMAIYRVGEQTPIGVSEAVHRALAEIERDLPPGISVVVNRDRSEIYRQRLELLLRNGFLGLGLVLLVLGVFLDLRLAGWVTLGIPTAFLGALLFLPFFDVTINMISMFAFIIALGIVVDDAIVAGENIYRHREQGASFVEAAIKGAREIAGPIGFSIASNVVAFLPLLFLPGMIGKTWHVVPLVVTATFLVSWIEALVILPAHLAHGRRGYRNPVFAMIERGQQAFSRLFLRFVDRAYRPLLARCMRLRYLTVAVMGATLLVVVAFAASGRLGFVLMPKVESDEAIVTARLPLGSPPDRVEEVRDRLVEAAQTLVAAHGGERLSKGILAEIREHVVEARVYLTPPEMRPVSTAALTDLWRDAVGRLPGVDSLRFESDRGGPGRGPAVTVELSHREIGVLDRASTALARQLEGFDAARDVDDGYTPGKRQFDFTIRPEGQSVGLTANEVARQVRAAFHGTEALRQQRGRDEVKLLVRLPEEQRTSEYEVERLLIRTPAGTEVPLSEVVDVEAGRAYTTIQRRDGRRTVTVTANVVPPTETQRVLDALQRDVLPALVTAHPGLTHSFEGNQAELRDALAALINGLLVAVVLIYVMLAIPFRSYVQPLVVMVALPFGVVGAILGHLWMGYDLSMISLMGVVALCGVVVNDSLLMVEFANRRRAEGMSAHEAMLGSATLRFRPILLTTLTTFGGLAPMIFETSRQARFMIPMAISLGYGIVFATAITLVLVPSLYLVIEDLRALPTRVRLPRAWRVPAPLPEVVRR